MILTDEEIKAALDSVAPCLEDRDIMYSRAIEAAIMAKFEVVAWAHINYEDGGYADCLQSYADAFCREPLYAMKENGK